MLRQRRAGSAMIDFEQVALALEVESSDRLPAPLAEEIARIAGHSSSRTTEVVYRRELRPVLTTGAEAMDKLFNPRAS